MPKRRQSELSTKSPKRLKKSFTKTSTKSQSIDFQMIVGYFVDDLPKTPKELKQLMKSKRLYQLLNDSMGTKDGMVGVGKYGKDYNVYNVFPHVDVSNIKSIVVEKPPIPDPNLWERMLGKHKQYQPNFIIKLKLKNVKLIPYSRPSKQDKVFDLNTSDKTQVNEFLQFYMYSANHHFHASDGWIGEMQKHKNDAMYILQIADLSCDLKVDWRKFGGDNPF